MIERVCVIGAGSIGSLFAGHLAQVADVSRADPAPGARRGAQRATGCVSRPERPPCRRRPRPPTPTRSSRSTSASSRPRRTGSRTPRRRSRADSRSATIMTSLNGLGAEEVIRAHGDWPIVSAVTFMSGTKHSDTEVEYVLDTETWLGPYEDTPFERVEEVGDLIDARRAQGRGAARPAPGAVVEADLQRHRQLRRGPHRAPPRPPLRRRGASRPISAISSTTSSTRARRSPRRPGVELHDDPWEMNVLATRRGSRALSVDARGRRSTQTDRDRPDHRRARARGGASTASTVPLHTALYRLVKAKEASW